MHRVQIHTKGYQLQKKVITLLYPPEGIDGYSCYDFDGALFDLDEPIVTVNFLAITDKDSLINIDFRNTNLCIQPIGKLVSQVEACMGEPIGISIFTNDISPFRHPWPNPINRCYHSVGN